MLRIWVLLIMVAPLFVHPLSPFQQRAIIEEAPNGTSRSTIAYWRFEGGKADQAAIGNVPIIDYSGHKLVGEAIFGPTYRTDVPSQRVPQTKARNNLSLEFNGRNQRIFIPDYQALQLTHSLTLEAYVKVRSLKDYGTQIICRGDDRIGLDPYTLTVEQGSFGFTVQNELNQGASLRAPFPETNRWYHVAGTLDDSTGEMKLYIDGQVVAHGLTHIRPFARLDPTKKPGIGIGNVQSETYNEHFDGLIDEVRISDVALREDQLLCNTPEGNKN